MLVSPSHGSPSTLGFSLTELLITLAIGLILLGMAAPSFTSLLNEINVSIAAHEFETACRLTRAEAIKRNRTIRLAAINGRWIEGWIITSPEGSIINQHDSLQKKIAHIDFKSTDGAAYFAYTGNGHPLSKNNSQQPQTGSLTLTSGKAQRRVIISFLGAIKVCNPATTSGPSCQLTNVE